MLVNEEFRFSLYKQTLAFRQVMARNSKKTVTMAEAIRNKCSFNTNTKEGNHKQAEQKNCNVQ
jgi:hypothetical protein